MTAARDLNHGPELHGDGAATFRVWAPRAAAVTLVLDGAALPMRRHERGWHERTGRVRAGSRYAFALDGGRARPDPATRRQPDGVHGASAVVDPGAFAWSPGEAAWRAPSVTAGATYELHVGTFTPEGTLGAAARRLEEVRDLGVTHVQVMPVNAFDGRRGWGYDGVAWYAVHEPYGGPDGLVAFVEAAHQAGLAVILDAVYNHLGPSGNYLPEFGPYAASGHDTGWGERINLDGPGSDAVRALVIGSALAWLRDYHVDALRLDAVHALEDSSAVHLLAELSSAVADLAGRLGRPLELVAESDRNDPRIVRPVDGGGFGMDAVWADDLHHALHVAVTGERDGYYVDYDGLPDVAGAYERGFVYDGERYSTYRERTVGAPLGTTGGHRLVACLQNHDQVGNRARGERLETLAGADLARAATVLLVAAPHVPLVFMGEEHGERNPFLYFCDHDDPALAEAVRRGRAREFASFGAFAAAVPDPLGEEAFTASRPDWTRRDTPRGRARLGLWRDLLSWRAALPAVHAGRRDLVEVLHVSATGFAAVRGGPSGPRAAVAANLAGAEAVLPAPAGDWTLLVSSADAAYGGPGDAPARAGERWRLPPRSAALWAAEPLERSPDHAPAAHVPDP